MRRGAIHRPDSTALKSAVDFNAVRVSGVTRPTNWFEAWEWQIEPDGDVLMNDRLGCCCEVADMRLIQAWQRSLGIYWAIPVELVTLRYAQMTGYDGTSATDGGTITQEDCFGWQAAPIVAAGREWNVKWLSVPPADVSPALKRGPLLVTLGLPPDDENDPDLWHNMPSGPPADFHRVIAGAERDGLLDVHSYGQRYLVHPARVVACDLMLRVDAPAALRTAGVDWAALEA